MKAYLPPDAYFDSAAVTTIFKVSSTGGIYSFTGNGNWSTDSNWLNNIVPPILLPAGSEVIIKPLEGGSCILDVDQVIQPGGKLTILPGSSFIVASHLLIEKL